MERIWTADLAAHAGERVRLAGWYQHLRRLRNVSFLILRDGKGLAQIVIEDPKLDARLADLSRESVLSVVGQAVREEQAPGGVGAARYPPPPQRVRVAGRRDGVHRGPQDGDGDPDRGDSRDD